MNRPGHDGRQKAKSHAPFAPNLLLTLYHREVYVFVCTFHLGVILIYFDGCYH